MEKSNENQPMPIDVNLKKGVKYYWCACGKTADEPFCDDSHCGSSIKPLEFTVEKDSHCGSSIKPLEFTVEKDRRAFLCSCKKTKKPPYCDGSHEDDISYIMSELG